MVNKFESELLHATEAEFLAALKLHRPKLFELSDAERTVAVRRWQDSARRNPAPGNRRYVSTRRAFAEAERLVQTGASLDQALTEALSAHRIEYPSKSPSGSGNDPKTWFRKIKLTYRDIPTHTHYLLNIEVPYGLKHAQEAMIESLPDVIAAIFITSNSEIRRKIIEFVF
jgi:hypothetical protein